jgi:APA family basic amino acid/polyamine antiporter
MVYYRNFSDLHATNRTPYKTNLLFYYSLVYLGFVPCQTHHMVSIGTLFAFSLVCIGVIVMRKTNPDAERGSRVPFVPVFLIGVIICLILMAGYLLKVGRLAI